MLAAFKHLETKFGINPTDVAHYAVNWDPKLFGKYSGLRCFLAKTAYKFDEELYHGRYAGIFGNQPSGYKNYLTLARSGFLKHVFRKLGTEVPKEAKVFPVEHHLAHAASAYYFSGAGSAAALTVDGEGERAASVVWKVVHGEFEKIAEVDTQKGSLGWLYGHTSEVMGFRPLEGEGKVMGLAPYGKLNRRIWKKMASIVRLLRDSDSPYMFNFGTKVRNPYLRHRKLAADLAEGLNLHWNPHGALNRDSIDLAWSLQNITEEVMMHLASFTKEYSNEHELVLAGGVALNAKASMRIHYSHIFDRLFIFPAANDAGGPVGAAAWVHHHLVGEKMNHVLKDAYLGPEYSA